MTADGSGGVSSEPETSDSLKTFGAVLKALREEAGLTQEEFAPRVQYSVHYIAKIEQGSVSRRRACRTGRGWCWARWRSEC